MPRRAPGPSLTRPVTEGTPGRAQTGVSAAAGSGRGARRQDGRVAAWGPAGCHAAWPLCRLCGAWINRP